MLCTNCGSHRATTLSDMGMLVVQCDDCGKLAIRRVQEARGVEWRNGVAKEVVAISGTIEVAH